MPRPRPIVTQEQIEEKAREIFPGLRPDMQHIHATAYYTALRVAQNQLTREWEDQHRDDQA